MAYANDCYSVIQKKQQIPC